MVRIYIRSEQPNPLWELGRFLWQLVVEELGCERVTCTEMGARGEDLNPHVVAEGGVCGLTHTKSPTWWEFFFPPNI